jgi:vacuolar-type H+-ATPase subunit H
MPTRHPNTDLVTRRCVIAILQLIDHLADALDRGRAIPLTALRVVDVNEFSHLIERMRISVPSSIMESERTLAERDHILAEAHAEAERILQQARQRAMEIVHQDQIVMTARDEAERILQESRRAANRRAEEADRYAVNVLEDLAQKLQVITKQVDNGIGVMKAKSLANRGEDSGEALPVARGNSARVSTG